MQKLIINIAVSVAIIVTASLATFFGTRAWVDYETRKVHDTWRMSQITQIHAGLVAYYYDHAAYPSSAAGPIPLGGPGSGCLSADGFVSPISHACTQKAYLPRIEAGLGKDARDTFIYRGLAKDGSAACLTKTPCPGFSLQFFLSTGSILPSGVHTLTSKGLK